MSSRRDAATEVRFDEHLGGYALAEDEDFSYRLSRLGRIRYVPDIVVEHRKLGFGSQDSRPFDRRVVVNRAYLFRKNFPQTPLARVQFFFFVLGLIGHRLINREWRGARGLLDGARRRLVPAVSAVPITFVSSHAHLGGEERYLLTLLEELGPDWIQEVVVLEDGPLLELLDGHPVTVIPTSRRAGIAVLGVEASAAPAPAPS